MKNSQSLLLTLAMVAPTCHAADSAPASLEKKLVALAGADSRNCGSVALGGDQKPAIACAKTGVSSAVPFRVAIQVQGIDSLVWQGAARDAQGKLWMVFHDSDPSGGGGAAPTLSAMLCRELVFSVDGKDALECNPVVGEH